MLSQSVNMALRWLPWLTRRYVRSFRKSKATAIAIPRRRRIASCALSLVAMMLPCNYYSFNHIRARSHLSLARYCLASMHPQYSSPLLGCCEHCSVKTCLRCKNSMYLHNGTCLQASDCPEGTIPTGGYPNWPASNVVEPATAVVALWMTEQQALSLNIRPRHPPTPTLNAGVNSLGRICTQPFTCKKRKARNGPLKVVVPRPCLAIPTCSTALTDVPFFRAYNQCHSDGLPSLSFRCGF